MVSNELLATSMSQWKPVEEMLQRGMLFDKMKQQNRLMFYQVCASRGWWAVWWVLETKRAPTTRRREVEAGTGAGRRGEVASESGRGRTELSES